MKALLFVPYAGIWQHTSLEVSVANQLEKIGIQTTIVSCGEVLNSPCLTMQAHGLTQVVPKETAQRVCSECSFHSKLMFTKASQRFLSLSEYLEQSDYVVVDELVESVSSENWADWSYQEIPIGAYASYEFLLNHKIVNEQIPDNLWPTYLNSVRNSLLCLIAIERILKRDHFDYLLSYNRLYSTNKTVSTLAERLGVKTISLSATGPMYDMYGRILMTYQDLQLTTFNTSESWQMAKTVPLNMRELKRVDRHLGEILRARSPWVYSTEFSGLTETTIRQRLKIKSGRKIVLLALSSVDEVFAASIIKALPPNYGTELLFESQMDWIHYILKIAPKFPQYHFVIRVHPREFPNKRESVLSGNAISLLDLANNKHIENVSFNFPDDEISLYDFIGITDRLLTSNSSAAIEFAAHGIPVIAHNGNNNTNFPSEIMMTASSLSEYNELLSTDSFSENQFERLRYAHRWIYYRNFRLGAETRFFQRRLRSKIILYAINLGLKHEVSQFFIQYLFRLGKRFVFPIYKGNLVLDQELPTFSVKGDALKSETYETEYLSRFLQHSEVFDHSSPSR